MWSDLFSALKAMDFKQVNKILGGLDVLTLLKNPWVIAIMVIICIVLVIRRGEKALGIGIECPETADFHWRVSRHCCGECLLPLCSLITKQAEI
jgi:hypothetical protein